MNTQTETKIEIETGSYNARRYGKPWIAVVDFKANIKGEYAWGEWIGDARNGSAGMLIITTHEGDIVARGHKDFRQSKNSAPRFYQVREGALVFLPGGKAEAYKLATGV